LATQWPQLMPVTSIVAVVTGFGVATDIVRPPERDASFE
jgi:hypothetical protein